MLPDCEQMPVRDFLDMNILQVLLEHRNDDTYNVRDLLPEERRWLVHGLFLAERTLNAILDVTVGEMMEYHAKTRGIPKQRGRPVDPLYFAAFIDVWVGGFDRMDVYRDMVLPTLVAKGEIPLTPEGDPDPAAELAARGAYVSAMERYVRKYGNPTTT